QGLAPRGLARRLGIWVALSTVVSLCVFAAVAFAVLILAEEAEGTQDAPEQILSEAYQEVGEAMLIAAPLGISLAIVGAVVCARHALRPFERVIEAATHITARDLNERLPLPATEDEVRDVVIAFNGLLARLETGFRQLDRFALDVSHELRTPITVLSTELEVMLQFPRSGPEWEQAARSCLEEVRHLGQLVEALLEMARAERAAAPNQPGATLATLVERVLALAGPRARERGTTLTAALGAEAGRSIDGNAAALLSALLSVVDNAVRYTPQGGEVRIWSVEQGDGTLQVCVDDNGAGIAPDERARIFEPFARGAAGIATPGGLGLGLAVARRICEHNATRLTVDSSPHGGARFSFVFGSKPA
ncbi:MAG TPA: ATP-binding protein, partial [Polyangiales bacterium]|nr:ATP-binding protein [Polyangiales bacterium]